MQAAELTFELKPLIDCLKPSCKARIFHLSSRVALWNDTMMCSTCLAALQELKHATSVSDKSVSMVHHGTIAGLAQAATRGCLFCRTLWAQCSESERQLLLASDGGEDLLAAQGLPAQHDTTFEAICRRFVVEESCGTVCYVLANRDLVDPDSYDVQCRDRTGEDVTTLPIRHSRPNGVVPPQSIFDERLEDGACLALSPN